jgi:peroxiredoxin
VLRSSCQNQHNYYNNTNLCLAGCASKCIDFLPENNVATYAIAKDLIYNNIFPPASSFVPRRDIVHSSFRDLRICIVCSVAFYTTCCWPVVNRAQAEEKNTDGPAPGHSQHGEAFDEGPRQAAYLIPGTGGPAFPVTTKSEQAQQFINQGVGQLHGFWYWESERSFRQAALLDPDCAMAYWGLAMSNPNNDQRATTFIREAVKRKSKASAAEVQYIELASNYYEAVDKEKKAEADKKVADQKQAAKQSEPAKPDQKQPAAPKSDASKPAEPSEAEQKSDEPRKIEDCSPDAESETEKKLTAAEKRITELQQQIKQVEEKLKQQQAESSKKVSDLEKQLAEAKKKLADEQRKAEAAAKKAADEAKKKAKRDRTEARLKAWDKLVQDYPRDTHAAAFYVYQLWHDRDVVPIQNYALVDAMLDKIFAQEPMHPAHHYRIHLWDNNRPEKAVSSAAQGGPAAPGIAHMWHMPGHTYSKLKRFHDAVYQQEASARVDHAYMLRDRVLPYQIHNYAHNNEWCIRNMLTIGRVQDALQLSKNLIEIPRHPKLNNGKDNSTAGGWGRDRLYDTLVRNELWPELIELANTSYLNEGTDNEVAELRRRRYLAVGLALTGKNTSQVDTEIAWFEQQQKDYKATPISDSKATSPEKKDADKKETEKKDADAAKAKTPAPKKKSEIDDLVRRCEESLNHIKAARLTAKGEHAEAVKLYKKVGNLPKEHLVWAYIAAADYKEALKIAKEQAKPADKSVIARAALVAATWHNQEQEEAKKEFEKLRTLAATADLNLPALQRLQDIAKACDYPTDWRLPVTPASDLGDRPALDSLGPLTWSPATATDWTLPDADGKMVSLSKNYQRKPVVVIFYLGYGCLHCIEQLNTFGPKAKEFQAAGIDLVAISSDDVEKLKKTAEQAKQEGGFPFPILSDGTQQVFKQYRSYDDFENKALHGTFLIDAQGRIRWQDISADPFTDADFLLKESQRLLSLEKRPIQKSVNSAAE